MNRFINELYYPIIMKEIQMENTMKSLKELCFIWLIIFIVYFFVSVIGNGCDTRMHNPQTINVPIP